MTLPLRLTSRCLFLSLVALAMPKLAWSQLEEVTVTAQKRTESVQELGLSVTALDEDQFRELTAGRLDGLVAQLTNVQAYATNTFIQNVHVRGIGLNEFQGQYDSPVAKHFDEVYVSKPWMAARPVYDIERVEVLKGPQGTVFGRNTTGGSVNYYTKAPSQEKSAALEFGLDQHERYVLEGHLNGSLSERLAGRISFRHDFGSGGPQKNLFDGEEHGEPDLLDVRAQLLWEGERLRVRALFEGGYDRGEKVAYKGPGIFNFGAPGFCPALFSGEVTDNPSECAKFAGFAAQAGFPEGEFEPDGAFVINQNTPPAVDDTFYGGYLRWEYDLPWGTLTSITGFDYYERVHIEDSQSDIFDAVSTYYYDEMRQFNQELRLTGTQDRFRYVVGLYYERDDLEQVDGSDLSGQFLPGITPPFADQFFAEVEVDVESFAAYADIEYDVSETLSITAGLRYTEDDTEANDVLLGIGNLPQVGTERFVTPCLITTFPEGPVGSEACPFLGPIAPRFNDSRTDEDLAWRLGVEWNVNPQILLWANLTTGFRSGGYSLPFAGAATTFEPEELFAQEIGIKSRWLDNTLQLNAAIFRYDYDDVQVNVDDPVSPVVPITRNIGEQENIGVEVELEWQPTENWYVKQGVGYLDAEFQDTDRAISTYAGVIPLDGKRPVNTPEWTYNGIVRYQRPISERLRLVLMTDYRWVDDRFLEATNQIFDEADSYAVVNARAAIGTIDGRWEVALFARNLFDEEYLSYINNIAFFKLDIFGETRAYGATVRYQF